MNRYFQELWGCREEPNGDSGLYTHNVTPIFENNTAARWVKEAMKLNNPALLGIGYPGQQAEGIPGAPTHRRGRHRSHPLDNIIPPPAEDTINIIREVSDDDGERWRPNQRSFPRTKTRFQNFEWMLQGWNIRQQQYVEVIRNRALGPFADYEQSLVGDEDVAWQCTHENIVSPPVGGSLARRKCTSSPLTCKFVVVMVECTGRTVVQRFALWVGRFSHLGGWMDWW